MKTHLLINRTMQNIFLRYALENNLTTVVPPCCEWRLIHAEDKNAPFSKEMLDLLPWHDEYVANGTYDVMALHTRWNFTAFRCF